MKHISNEPLLRLNLQQFAEGDESANETGTGTPAENTENDGKQAGAGEGATDNSPEAMAAEIARLKAEAARRDAEFAKQKTALDNATREAGDYRKQLRARMTQEEIDAKAKEDAEEQRNKELDELRKKVARSENTKAVMSVLKVSEEDAGQIADHMNGCEDIANALLLIQKVWVAREKELRKEFGKITAPGAGADSNSPEAQAIIQARQIGKQNAASAENAQKALNAYMR